MPEQRDNDRDRLIEIEAVLELLEQVKADTVKMIISLQRERGHKKPRRRHARKLR
jgi:hypothetical protein